MATTTVASASALISALHSAKAGDTILLASGTYGAILISDLKFSANVTIASASATNPAVLTSLTVSASSGLTFYDLELSGSGLSPFMIEHSQNITLANLHVHGSLTRPVQSQTAYGLDVIGSTNVAISNSRFHDLKMGIVASGNGITIADNRFRNIREHGIHLGQISNITITKNYITDIRPANGDHPDAIIFMSGATASSSNIYVTNNVITRGTGQSAQGIFFNDNTGHPFTSLDIADNLLIGEGYNGIGVYGASGVKITGNDVAGYAALKDWILLSGVKQAALTDNKASTYIFYPSDGGVVQSGDTISPIVTDGGALLTSQWLAHNPSFSAEPLQHVGSRSTSGTATGAASTITSAILAPAVASSASFVGAMAATATSASDLSTSRTTLAMTPAVISLAGSSIMAKSA